MKSKEGRLEGGGAVVGTRGSLGDRFVGGCLDLDSFFGDYTNAMMHAHEYASMNNAKQGIQHEP